MAKRHATEALEDIVGTDSPASKKSRLYQASATDFHNGTELPARAKPGEPTSPSDVESDDDEENSTPVAVSTRQQAPIEGFDDLYLDTIDRHVLDFDFEKLCYVSLSNINVYACLVCGKYYQGRGRSSHAYFHSLDENHHVFINISTLRIYVLPESYEVKHKSLEDIKYVVNPTYTKEDV